MLNKHIGLCPYPYFNFSDKNTALRWIFLFRSFQRGFCLFNDAVSFETEDVLVLFKEGAELLFVVAQLFSAARAGEAAVGLLIEALGVAKSGDFPVEQEKKRHTEDGVCIDVRDKYKGCEHHGVIPVVDAAASTAFVLHKPGLEGTEEENADHITNGEGQADHHKNTRIDHVGKVE